MSILAKIQQLDVQTFLWCMTRSKRQPLTRISYYLSKSADGLPYLVIATWLFYHNTVFDVRWLAALTAAFACERGIYFTLKNTIKRDRPQNALASFESFARAGDRFSFPSGHTSCAFLFAVFMAHLWPLSAPLWFSWAAAIGCSRVFLGVHFPGDTLAGAVMGTSLGYMVLLLAVV